MKNDSLSSLRLMHIHRNFEHEGQIWKSLRNSCLSVIKIVLDSMLYETLKWSQIAPFCISSKNKFRRGAIPDPLPFNIMACTLLSLSYALDVNFEPTTPFLSDKKKLTLSLNFVG